MKNSPYKTFVATFANDNAALIPERWAMEALLVLHENVVHLPLVHTDYANEVAEHGEVIHTHRPAKFEMERKVDGDDITIQDAKSSKVDIRLDFHSHTSFMIFDGERSKAFKDLIELYITPAMQSAAQEIDEVIGAQKYQFIANMVGKIGTAITKSTLVQINKVMNTNNVPQADRYFSMTPEMEANLLDELLFTDASQVGDDGTALREASIGKKFGLWNLMSQNMTTVDAMASAVTGAINNVGGYLKGATVLTVDGFGAAIANGSYLTVAGDNRPRRVVSTVGGGTPTQITIDTGLDTLVADDAVVTIYPSGAINNAAGYAQYYTKRMTVDGLTDAPQKGQLLAFAGTQKHGLIGNLNTTTSIKLDQATQVALADDAAFFLGPDGDFGMAFHRNAIAFISRPLVLPPTNSGVQAAVVDYKGVGIRVTMAYDYKKQGTAVTVDLLWGIKTLDDNLGVLVLR